MRRTLLSLLSLVLLLALLSGCGGLQPPDEAVVEILDQLEKSAEAVETGGGPAEDVEDVLEENTDRVARLVAIDLAAAIGVSLETIDEVRDIPSDGGYANTNSGTVAWGANTAAWSVYRWTTGRWEKKAEWINGAETIWGRYIKTSDAATAGDTMTRTFTRGLWVDDKLARYGTGTHALDTAGKITDVTGTIYRVIWSATNPSTVKRVVKVEHTHTVAWGGSSISTNAVNVSSIYNGAGYDPRGTWTGASIVYPNAAGTQTFLSASGEYVPTVAGAFTDIDTTHTVLGDKSQTIVRRTNYTDGSYRLTTLNFSSGGSGTGTINLYNGDETLAAELATLSWDDRGNGSMIILNGLGTDDDTIVTIHINIPRYLK